MGFPGSSAGKESAHNAGDLGLIPGLGRSPGEGKATHSSILENSMDCTVHGGHKESDTTEQLSLRFTSTQDSETHCDQGHHGGCVGNRGRQGRPPGDSRDEEGIKQTRCGWNSIPGEGIALGSSVKRAGLQFHSISHINIQLACKSVCPEPTHFWAISTAPPQLSPGISHLGQCRPSSQVCRLAPSDPTIYSPTSARGG